LIVVGLCVAAPTPRDVENLAQALRVKKALGLLGNPSDTTIERIIARLPVGPLREVLLAAAPGARLARLRGLGRGGRHSRLESRPPTG